jgi:hypothetical protein
VSIGVSCPPLSVFHVLLIPKRLKGKRIFSKFKVKIWEVPLRRVINIGSRIDTDSIAANDTQYRVSIGGTFQKGVPEGYGGGIDPYSNTDTSSVIIVCRYSLS